MIKEKAVKTGLNHHSKKHFSQLGYDVPEVISPKIKIEVNPEHLMSASGVNATVICDKCGRESGKRPWRNIVQDREIKGNRDLCNPCFNKENPYYYNLTESQFNLLVEIYERPHKYLIANKKYIDEALLDSFNTIGENGLEYYFESIENCVYDDEYIFLKLSDKGVYIVGSCLRDNRFTINKAVNYKDCLKKLLNKTKDGLTIYAKESREDLKEEVQSLYNLGLIKAQKKSEKLDTCFILSITERGSLMLNDCEKLELEFKDISTPSLSKNKFIESPIEKKLHKSLKENLNTNSYVVPQKDFIINNRKYRVDFYIEYNNKRFIVECDGHDHHEKTKE